MMLVHGSDRGLTMLTRFELGLDFSRRRRPKRAEVLTPEKGDDPDETGLSILRSSSSSQRV